MVPHFYGYGAVASDFMNTKIIFDHGLDYLDQIDIALLAPSRTGKSTLIAAMLVEFNRRLSLRRMEAVLSPLGGNDNIYEFASDVLEREVHAPVTTQAYIAQLQRDYGNALNRPGRKFEAALKGNRESLLLSFNLANEATAMPFRILDYPGGAVSSGSIVVNVKGKDASGLEDHAKVLKEYTKDCFAVVVPVFAMALVEQSELDEKKGKKEIDQNEFDVKSARLNAVLNIQDIRDRVTEWVLGRVDSRKHGLLVIAPVKCEVFINAPGNPRTHFERQGVLENVTHQYVFDVFCRDIVTTVESDCGSSFEKEEKLNEIAKLVSVEYLPVQTFGNVFEGAMLEWPPDLLERADDYGTTFKDLYYKRRGALPCPVGASRVIGTVLAHRNDLLVDAVKKLIRIRPALSNHPFGLLEWVMAGEDDKKRIVKFEKWIKNPQTLRMNELVVQIADLCLGTNKLKGWQWNFSTLP